MFKSKAINLLKMEENNATLDIRAINEKIEREGMSMFQEKLSATIGPFYVASFFLGGLIGLT